MRLDRARRIALRIRAALTDVPTGLGTFTDRPLPLLLPTTDRDAFASTVERSLGIERPPGLQSSTTISSFDAVAPFPLEGYFSPTAKKRLLVILTDAESTGFNEPGVRKSFEAKPRTAVVLVRIGRAGGARLRRERAAGERVHPAACDRGDAAPLPRRHARPRLRGGRRRRRGESGRRGARLRAGREPRLGDGEARPGAVAGAGGRRPAGGRFAPPESLARIRP